MKTTQPISPEQAGLTLSVLSGLRGVVLDAWPCIEYTVQLTRRRAVVWTGDYRLGVGHVNHRKPLPGFSGGSLHDSVLDAWRAGKTLVKRRDVMQAQADLAARFAKAQAVAPKLDDVAHSLLLNGAAFFDGQRFEDWAADNGYDADSRKAEALFKTCDDIGRTLSRALSRDELDGLLEWASSY